MKDLETRARFVELRAAGWAFARIAEELKVSKQTLIAWSKECQQLIGNLQAIEIDSLQERYKAAKRHRMETLGVILGKVVEEVKSRDLKTVSSEKLVELALKCSAAIKTEETEIVFKADGPSGFPDFLSQPSEVSWRA